MQELVKVGERLRDNAAENPLYLNYSNPMAMNMMAIDRVCGLPSVGLCHSVQGTSRQLANYASLPYEDITYRVAGINHVAFFLEFKYRGQDAYPLLFKALENPRVFASDKVRFEMMRRLGYFVTESSEHFSEYCPWFIHHGQKVIKEFGIPIDEYLRRCESIIATWKDTEKRMLADNQVSISKSVEYGSQIINSMETGDPSVIYGNVANRHHITNLPTGCCVEVPCLVDAQGVQPTHIGDLPPQLAAMCRSNIAVQELTVEAFLTGKREHIYHAVMMDPHTSSQLTLDEIWRMCDELIDAHQRDGFLPQFEPARKNTGRSAASLARVIATITDKRTHLADTKSTPLELVVTNETQQRYKGKLALDLDRRAFTSKMPATLPIDLAPGMSKTFPFVVTAKSPDQQLRIGIRGDGPTVLGLDYVQPARQAVRIGKDGHPIQIVWSGNTMAEGMLHVDAKGLLLALRVADTDVTANEEALREGSAIELFFASAGKADGLPVQIIVMPYRTKASVRTPRGAAVKGATAKIRADKGGYDIEAFIPAKAAGFTPGTPFLFEIQLRVNALGDAHGKVSQTWQNSPRPHQETTHYAVIQPTG